MHLTALNPHAPCASPSPARIVRWRSRGHLRVYERSVTRETIRRNSRDGAANFLEMRGVASHNLVIRIGGLRVGGTPFLVPPTAMVPGVVAGRCGAARDWRHPGRTVRESNDRDGPRGTRRAGCKQLNGLGVVQPDWVRGGLAQCECR
jgi:hypothetical protein